MVKRSLSAQATGIEKAKKIFNRKGWTQEYLAGVIGIETRQPIWKFFTGKPIERHIFIEICFQLDLDWHEIAEELSDDIPEMEVNEQVECLDVNALVTTVRSQHYSKIQAQCGKIQLLDIAQLIELERIYVDPNILKTIPGQRWLDISDLQVSNPEESECFGLSQVHQKEFPALKAVAAYPKLMILGKPGSGKTTFLQHIAIQCNLGVLQPERIPIFIRLNNFAEDAREIKDFSLFNYISNELSLMKISQQQIAILLHHGRALILLDGLDEIQKEDSTEVLKQIRKFSDRYYNNHFMITCRIGAHQYRFNDFTIIEIADFNQTQIEAFIQKWFIAVDSNSQSGGKARATQLIEKLQLSENKQIRQLIVTPLLLNLICLLFQVNVDFEANKYAIYKQALDILIIRWDEFKGIKRDIIRDFSVTSKLKLLCHLATINFENGNYFFEKSTLLEKISNYLCTLASCAYSDTKLQLDSENVLKSIEVGNGLLVERAREIYSFSHHVFQEYLTAKNFVSNPEPKALEKNLTNLVSHLSEPRWSEVFLLTASMLRNGNYLVRLMKQYIDKLVVDDEELQQFLCWVYHKSVSLQVPEKPETVRAFYLNQVIYNDGAIIAQSSEIVSNREIIPDLNIGHNWQFSDQQRKILQQYYNANQFLKYCLNSHLTVTPSMQQEIERTLYIPPTL